MKFELDNQEVMIYNKWYKAHEEICPFKNGENVGAIGGRLTFCFAGTSLGMIAKVKCACGEEKTLTDFTDW